jgi:hypothetical protein
MTYVEHDPMMEIVAKLSNVTLFELVLEFRRSEPTLRIMQSKVVLEFRHSEPALRVKLSKLRFEIRHLRAALRVTLSAAQSSHYAFRGLPLGILRYYYALHYQLPLSFVDEGFSTQI